MASAPAPAAPAPPPTAPPKPANPEPHQAPLDPEKGRVKTPEPGKSEHPAV
ncbi:MAG: hypothetical protein JWQ07_253 [Ramlibacter sp.]|nr:hypothetical protein [Ramlibacter sp.]